MPITSERTTDPVAPPTPAAPASPGPDARLRTRALVVIAAVLAVAALRLSEPVTLPLATAVFLLVVTRPLYCWVEERAPRWLAAAASTLAVLLAVAVIAGGFALSIGQVASRAPQIAERAQELVGQVRQLARARGVTLPPAAGGEGGGAGQLAERVFPVLSRVFATGGLTLERLGLVLAFYLLGLFEVAAFRDKALRRLRPPAGEAVVQTAADAAGRVRRFLVALTKTSLISGAATALFALAVGLDAPLTWGLVAFLLNYVPTIGPFVSVVPPTLYALVQFGGAGRVALVLFGLGALQFAIGNFVDPKIEGRAVSISALVILVSVAFWGWVWGVLGALLAVPLTVVLVTVCERFERSRWVAELLTEE